MSLLPCRSQFPITPAFNLPAPLSPVPVPDVAFHFPVSIFYFPFPYFSVFPVRPCRYLPRLQQLPLSYGKNTRVCPLWSNQFTRYNPYSVPYNAVFDPSLFPSSICAPYIENTGGGYPTPVYRWQQEGLCFSTSHGSRITSHDGPLALSITGCQNGNSRSDSGTGTGHSSARPGV